MLSSRVQLHLYHRTWFKSGKLGSFSTGSGRFMTEHGTTRATPLTRAVAAERGTFSGWAVQCAGILLPTDGRSVLTARVDQRTETVSGFYLSRMGPQSVFSACGS